MLIKINTAIADAHPILPPSDHIAGFIFHHAKANSKNVTIHAITDVIQIFFVIIVQYIVIQLFPNYNLHKMNIYELMHCKYLLFEMLLK